MKNRYPRDMLGYGASPPQPRWPDKAVLAVQFVINYEEGGERSLLHGDDESEAFLSEIPAASPWPGKRHWNMESVYEYGARAGFWRLHRLFTEKAVPVTIYGVATALMRGPQQVAAMQEAGWEIASHGLKWIDYADFTKQEEQQHMQQAIRLHMAATGSRPTGWYTGRCSANTLDIVSEEGGFDYCADSYADDLPYWHDHDGKSQLVIPYTLDANDMRFAAAEGFAQGEDFFTYLKDSFDCLYAEGMAGQPKMMSVGLHCRLAGRPGRAAALRRFLDYCQQHDRIWYARRIDIARHWRENHPPLSAVAAQMLPSVMAKRQFVKTYGGVFEHSPWVAEAAWEAELGPANNTATGLHAALAAQFRQADEDKRLAVLNAHPDLAGKLAIAGKLTESSTTEQASAGLDQLTEDEHARFTMLNNSYRQQFGFPFIIAVRGLDKQAILAAFERRLNNSQAAEQAEACRQVERIALLRLRAMLED